MVIQQGVPVPVWGTAAPGEKVTVRFRDQQKSTETDAQGKWMVKLDPVQVGEPGTLTIAGSNTVTIKDVLVGEVWVGSGQSNMDTPVDIYIQDTTASAPPGTSQPMKDAAIKWHGADDVLAQMAKQDYPQLRYISSRDGKGWEVVNSRDIRQLSALLFVFGCQLQKQLNVPVGLMFGALGATSSEQWISKDAYQSDQACKEALAKFSAAYSPEAEQKKYDQAYAQWQAAMAAWNQAAHPAGSKPPAEPRRLFHPGDVTRDTTLPHKNIGDLYELYVRPFIPYAIRGVLWDQGEGGTGIFGLDQYPLMGALIRGWRNDWGQGDFPFIYMQKPSGRGCAWDPSDPVTRLAEPFTPILPKLAPTTRRGLDRESYIRIMRYPNTAMVTTSDLGQGTHPINKSGYGTRAARVALGAVYGRKIQIYGPIYDSFKIEGNRIRVHFTQTGQGLAFRPGDKLQGFAIAGADQLFHWAGSVIDGDTVVVSSPEVANPVAVRYAWDAIHPWANLFNKDGLPALEFRTDDWPDTP
jgi:sialate O-acetylesterase